MVTRTELAVDGKAQLLTVEAVGALGIGGAEKDAAAQHMDHAPKPRACPADHAWAAGSATHICRVVVGRRFPKPRHDPPDRP
ncbi:hypothetical protein SGFS_015230 [Streptomyces graminofaciens]|uniref:Uncharacterized protein n=1 Tax=Streptomyces graminofaciens TaxID=68212 RepID=A0ABN5VAD6_9ACTN|nr:hypothetical protein SGFS_015230 [Streptomyces graminofaciens]